MKKRFWRRSPGCGNSGHGIRPQGKSDTQEIMCRPQVVNTVDVLNETVEIGERVLLD